MLLHTRRGRVYVEDERPQIDARHGEGEGASARCLARRLKSEISRSDRQTIVCEISHSRVVVRLTL